MRYRGIMDNMKTEKKPSRLSVPKAGLPRIYRIDAEIASGRYPNTRTLAEMFQNDWGKVSISTIVRDIDFLRDTFRAPLEYDAFHRGYYYTDKTFRIPAGFAGAEELLALGMAKNILTLYQDTPIYEAANNLLNSISAPLSADGNSEWFENRIVVPQLPSSPIPQDIWDPITSALKENLILSFDYQGAYDDDYISRRVRPYQLLFDNGLWYLFAYAEYKKETRIYSLLRIKNITLTNEKFSLPANFDYRKINSGSYFGVFMGQEKHFFRIAFYGYSIAVIKDRKWAEDQKILDTEDGIEITFSSTQYEKVLEWVLSRGCYAQPLEPEVLVKSWRDNIKEMQKLARAK